MGAFAIARNHAGAFASVAVLQIGDERCEIARRLWRILDAGERRRNEITRQSGHAFGLGAGARPRVHQHATDVHDQPSEQQSGKQQIQAIAKGDLAPHETPPKVSDSNSLAVRLWSGKSRRLSVRSP
jgi:hypothetical protein